MVFREPEHPALRRALGLVRRAALAPRSVVLTERTATDPSRSLRVAYIGEGESAEYLRRTYFPAAAPTTARRLPLWRVNAAAARLVGPDSLLFVEVNRLWAALAPRSRWRTLPWIRARVVLDDAWRRSRRRGIEHTFGRKVRQFGYRARRTREPELVAAFHRDLYAPHVTARFETEVRLRPVSELQALVDDGFLLQVFCGERWVSGAVCRLRGATLSVHAFGHLPPEEWDLRRGALSGVYYFIFEWAAQNSVREVDLLRSRANTADGVFEHKRRWGAVPVPDDWRHTVIEIFPPAAPLIPPVLRRQLLLVDGRLVELGAVLEGEGPRGAPAATPAPGATAPT